MKNLCVIENLDIWSYGSPTGTLTFYVSRVKQKVWSRDERDRVSWVDKGFTNPFLHSDWLIPACNLSKDINQLFVELIFVFAETWLQVQLLAWLAWFRTFETH